MRSLEAKKTQQIKAALVGLLSASASLEAPGRSGSGLLPGAGRGRAESFVSSGTADGQTYSPFGEQDISVHKEVAGRAAGRGCSPLASSQNCVLTPRDPVPDGQARVGWRGVCLPAAPPEKGVGRRPHGFDAFRQEAQDITSTAWWLLTLRCLNSSCHS